MSFPLCACVHDWLAHANAFYLLREGACLWYFQCHSSCNSSSLSVNVLKSCAIHDMRTVQNVSWAEIFQSVILCKILGNVIEVNHKSGNTDPNMNRMKGNRRTRVGSEQTCCVSCLPWVTRKKMGWWGEGIHEQKSAEMEGIIWSKVNNDFSAPFMGNQALLTQWKYCWSG